MFRPVIGDERGALQQDDESGRSANAAFLQFLASGENYCEKSLVHL
jgi:hypothetical protein